MFAQVDHLQLIGRGGHGLVLRGEWQLAEVAVKIAVADPASLGPSAFWKRILEGPLSKRLRAPNVVETYCHMCSQLTAQDADQSLAAECSGSGHRRSAPARLGLTPAGTRCGAARVTEMAAVEANGLSPRSGAEAGCPGRDLATVSFDSLDGFGSPNHRRSCGPFLSHSEALRLAGATPGCYVTQIIMEYCDQGSLMEAIARGAYKRAAEDRTKMFGYLRTLYDIAAGMSYLHSVGVIHGDLKPGNVLLRSSRVDSRGYQAKVADFGLAKCGPTETQPGVTSTGEKAEATGREGATAARVDLDADWSSSPYMAPEHFDGALGAPCDVWSFGATAHHMWTGELPHGSLHPLQVCAGVCDGSLRLAQPPDMPRRLWRLLRACLAHNAAHRPSVARVRAALARLQEELCGV